MMSVCVTLGIQIRKSYVKKFIISVGKFYIFLIFKGLVHMITILAPAPIVVIEPGEYEITIKNFGSLSVIPLLPLFSPKKA